MAISFKDYLLKDNQGNYDLFTKEYLSDVKTSLKKLIELGY